jgi:tRNA (uracil-5-)-methyltransferase
MTCEYFGECGGCALPLDYDAQLERKKAAFLERFGGFETPEIKVFSSKKSHFRNRGEFRVWHETDGGMALSTHKKEGGGVMSASRCPAMHEKFCENMRAMTDFIADYSALSERLFELDFLTTTDGGEMIVTLIYHKAIGEEWDGAAAAFGERFGVSVIGRSKGKKRVIGNDYVTEKIVINDREWSYKQNEGTFTQPNGYINRAMIGYLCDHIKPSGGDYLELYCGNGNFTLPTSQKVNNAIAIEVNRRSLEAAKENAKNNDCDNIFFARMSAEEFADAMDRVRQFNRLKDIDLGAYNFSTALVDPPRAGLDPNSLKLVANIERIVYVSCNPETLQRDLETLTKTHAIASLALFDQFPYTEHIESAVILSKYKRS